MGGQVQGCGVCGGCAGEGGGGGRRSMPWLRSLDSVRSRANSLASPWDESSIITATPASSTTSSIPVSPAYCPDTAFTRSPACSATAAPSAGISIV